MRAYEFLKSGFQTWVALCNLILYTVIAESLFIYRIDSELQIYKIKFEAYLNNFFYMCIQCHIYLNQILFS